MPPNATPQPLPEAGIEEDFTIRAPAERD